MKRVKIRRERDLEWLRDVHRVAFPHDIWPGDDNVFWVATRGDELLGLASGKMLGEDGFELTRCAVVTSAQGQGLQRRMLKVREQYAKRVGCTAVWTYTTRDNYPSITNLVWCGYRFASVQPRSDFFYFTKGL